MQPQMMPLSSPGDDGCYHRSSNDPPDHAAHIRSRSTAHAHTPRRLSMFSARSRSNTTTSTSSPLSPGSSMTSMDGADERAPSAMGLRSEKPDRSSRFFLSRGSRILRRQGSKINIVATLDEEDEVDREKSRSEKSDIFGRHRGRQPDHRKFPHISPSNCACSPANSHLQMIV